MMRPASPRRQAGAGLVTAIFLLVVIAGLAAALVTIFTAQQTESQLDQQGARAYQAARTGIEWGLFRYIQSGDNCPAEGVATSFALPDTSVLRGFSVSVVCTSTPGPGGDVPTTVRRISATACNQRTSAGACGPNPANNLDYVQRVIEVQL